MRERKRARTRRRLEETAVGLVLREGLEHVTVDAISAAADVSSRTFFNYFDSKEDAILGIGDTDASKIQEHLASYDDGDVVATVVGLFISVFEQAINDSALHRKRMQVVRRHPDLLSRQMTRMTTMNEQLAQAVLRLIATRGSSLGLDSPGLESAASIIVMTCAAALRAAVREWAEIENGTDISLPDLQRRATALVRETTDLLR